MRKNCGTCLHEGSDFFQFACPCDDCYNTSDAPTKWEPAKHYKPDTNADSIRAMSDEELAKEFADCAIGLYCDTRKEGLPELPESVKREVFASLLEWLKQPAEGE